VFFTSYSQARYAPAREGREIISGLKGGQVKSRKLAELYFQKPRSLALTNQAILTAQREIS
jgi:hypothetical protein